MPAAPGKRDPLAPSIPRRLFPARYHKCSYASAMLDLRRQYTPLGTALREAFHRVLDSGNYILGPEVERFERDAAGVAGARFAVGVSSGTDALLLAFMALGLGPEDEVICPTFTFFATAGWRASAIHPSSPIRTRSASTSMPPPSSA